MTRRVKVGTRESELAIWQASHVKTLLQECGLDADLVFIKSDGDLDTVTPLYELGVQGIFTKSLDVALLNGTVDIAVHSMKDVPTQPARGIRQAAVLKRASYKDILVFKHEAEFLDNTHGEAIIATSSIRRIAQWTHRYPNHTMVNLRGNVNTRIRKVNESNWNGAIFAAAGVERINLRPSNSIDLDWMLPAPAQGAIIVVCREDDYDMAEACKELNDPQTERCTKIERDFLRTLSGGCSTPISALAIESEGNIVFKGSLCSVDGKEMMSIEKIFSIDSLDGGKHAANEILKDATAQQILHTIRNAR